MNREAIEKRTLRISVLMGCILTGIEVTGAIIFRSNTVLKLINLIRIKYLIPSRIN